MIRMKLCRGVRERNKILVAGKKVSANTREMLFKSFVGKKDLVRHGFARQTVITEFTNIIRL